MTTPNHQAELLPCPICGAKAFLLHIGLAMSTRLRATCECEGCDTHGPVRATRAEAIVAWNTRPASHEAELVEALEAIAAPCVVSLDDCPDHDQPNGWRDLAVARVDIARAILAKAKAGAS